MYVLRPDDTPDTEGQTRPALRSPTGPSRRVDLQPSARDRRRSDEATARTDSLKGEPKSVSDVLAMPSFSGCEWADSDL
jgi:hypothetical protein